MNPFSLTYDKLHEMALQNSVLQGFMKPKNVIRLDKKNSQKANISSADLPELLLLQVGTEGQLAASSSSCVLNVEYSFISTTGAYDLDIASAVQWGLITLSSSWCTELTTLTWEERSFIKNVELGPSNVSLAGEELRGYTGWTVVWPLVITMFFNKKTLMSYQVKE